MHYFDEFRIDELMMEEFFRGFDSVLEMALDHINLINQDNVQVHDISKYVLLLGDNNENYSKYEFEIFSVVEKFKVLNVLDDSISDLTIFEIVFDVDEIDHDFFTCAIVKILDKAIKKPLMVFSVNCDELLIGVNIPREYEFSDNFLCTKTIGFDDFKAFVIFLNELLLYDSDIHEFYLSIIDFVLDDCGIFETREHFTGPLTYDEVKYYMKLFYITYNRHMPDAYKEYAEYNRVTDYQKKYKLLSKELEFIRYRNENSYDYINYVVEDSYEQVNLFGAIDNASNDEIDELIEKISDEEFDDPINLLDI